MAKKSATRSAGRATSWQTMIPSPRKPAGRQSKTDAERLDDLLAKSDPKALAPRPREGRKPKKK
jgi:hypothetical protein